MEDFDPPSDDPSPGDAAHKITRTALSAIPVAGGPAVELFEAVVTPPLQRRLQAWRERIGRALKELEERIDNIESRLSSNDAFIDTALQASYIATRTSNETKLHALENAVINSALREAPDESLQSMFLSYIDSFTVWHLLILELFDDPQAWATKNGKPFQNRSQGSISHVLEDAYPTLRGHRDFYDQVWRDLHSRGLLTTDSPHGMMTGSGMLARRTTDMGRRFVRYTSGNSET